MKHFQIKLTDRRGLGSFLYFDANEDNMEEKACETANQYLQKKRDSDELLRGIFFHKSYKPFRTVKVVEYNKTNRSTQRGGTKFNLNLSYIEFKLQSGQKIRDEWYKAE